MAEKIIYQAQNITIRHNFEKKGIEIIFPEKPNEIERTNLKKAGFRWSSRNRLWWAKESPSVSDFINSRMKMEHNKKNLENMQMEIFSLEDYLVSLEHDGNEALKPVDTETDKPYYVNNNIYKNIQTLSKEEHDESSKSSTDKTGESENPERDVRRGSSEDDVEQFPVRKDSGMGGNTGGRHSGIGYGNNFPEYPPQGTETVVSVSNDSTTSNGQVFGSTEKNDGNPSFRLHNSHLPQGEVDNGISKSYGSVEQSGYGNERGAGLNQPLSNVQSRNIRVRVKEILSSYSDDEIRNNAEFTALLTQYEGGGGLQEDNATSAEVLNAFYTPRKIVRTAWELADFYSPDARTVLEPSSGIGRFAENRNNLFTLIELDKTSARIARILHPDAEVIQGAFQSQFYDETGTVKNKNYELPKYDLVIGNPPYGNYTGEWKGKGEGSEHNRIEEYFIEKGLESLKDENSSLVFIVPSGWLRSGRDKIKELISGKGRLVDAWRLPNGVFDSTDVGTDIIIMKKHKDLDQAKIKGLELGEVIIESKKNKADEISNDFWFKKYPEKILGEEIIRNGRFGPEPFVKLPENKTLQDMLDTVSEKIKKQKCINAVKALKNINLREKNNFTTSIQNVENSFSQKFSGFRLEYSPEKKGYFLTANPSRGGKERVLLSNLLNLNEQNILEFINEKGLELDSIEIENGKKVEITNEKEVKNNKSNILPTTTEEKSNIEKAVYKILNTKDLATDKNVRTFLNITRDFKEKDFAKWNDIDWKNTYLNPKFTTCFDIETKQVLITREIENKEKALFATIFPDGTVKTAFDKYSQEFKNLKLTKTRIEKIDHIMDVYSKQFQNVIDGYIGMKDNNAYFASKNFNTISYVFEQKNRPGYRNNSVVFNSTDLEKIKIEKLYNVVMSKTRFYTNYESTGEDNEEIPLFSSIKNIFDKNISNIEDDNNLARLSGDEVEIPEFKNFTYFDKKNNSNKNSAWDEYFKQKETINDKIKERWEKALDVVVKLSGCENEDEYFSKIDLILAEKTKERNIKFNENKKERMSEEDADIILNEILLHDFTKPSETVYHIAGSSIQFTQNKDNHSAVDVVIDGKLSLLINSPENKISSYNNYMVTPNFLKRISERWGIFPEVSDIKVADAERSLEKILKNNKKTYKNHNTGKKIIDSIYENRTIGNVEIDNQKFRIKTFGTIIKVFSDGSNYPICEIDTKINRLVLNQDSYQMGLISGIEERFKEKNNKQKTFIMKDITIDGIRYIDTDGKTIIAPIKGQRYNPEKEKLMDNQEFIDRYGKNWDKNDRPFWVATDYKGFVDTSKLTDDEKQKLKKSANYCRFKDTETGDWKYIHKELYASGNIYAKLDELEKNRPQNDEEIEVYNRNKAILYDSLPKQLSLEQIEISVISPFAQELKLNGEPLTEKFIKWASGYDIEESINRREQISDYSIAGINREDIPPTITWSDVTNYIDGKALPVTKDKTLSENEKNHIRNQKINDRRETAEKLFNRFLQTALTKEEEEYFVSSYNRFFNYNRDPDYSKLPLYVDGMNLYRKGGRFRLYEQQIKGISFLCNKGNGLLAYDVGVGKTAAGIVATVQQIQSGRSLRPLIIVPKSVIGKWESDIHELFPDIQVNNLGNFSKEDTFLYYNKKNHGLNIPAGSITLITKDALYNTHWDNETIDKFLFSDYADLLGITEDLYDPNPKVRASAREKIYREANGKVRDINYIEWKNTGFDHVTVDEAHAYKKLERKPHSPVGKDSEFSRIVGSGEPSGIAKKMFNITQIIQQENENRNVFMLTATPFTNSPLEVYSMLVYVARKELEQCGIKNLNDFCSQYAKTRYERVVKPNGDVEMATVMKEWGDLKGLQNILKQYIDKVDGEEAGIIRPVKKTHKVNLEATELQKQIFDFAINSVMTYKPNKNAGEKGAPVLEAMNMLRTACLSPALLMQEKFINPQTKKTAGIEIPPIEQVVECSPKLKLVCDTVVSNWKKYSNCGQVIYMPEGTAAYPYVIDYMVKKGVPINVFASIDGQSAKIGGKNVKITKDDENEDVRAKVASAFNDKNNPCKILIGSAAISEGMDLNGNSIALYNTMIGWNPSECIQVEGRIWRQGNEQGHVHIVYPLIYDSIDSLLFQKHDEKESRIDLLFKYDGKKLNVSGLDPEKLKYELIKDPVKRAKIKIEDEALIIKNEIILLDSRLGDYDSLVESKIKYKEKLTEKEASLKLYKENYAKSLASGKPNRSEEEQQKGLSRFEKAINDYKRQLENINRKYAEMGITNDTEKSEYVRKINAEKQSKLKELEYIFGEKNYKKIIDEMKQKISEEKTAELEGSLLNPLDKTIQEDLIPFEKIERKIKEERYNQALKNAETENEKRELTEEWQEYLDGYNIKFKDNIVNRDINLEKQQNPVSVRIDTTQQSEAYPSLDDITVIISHEIELYNSLKTEEAVKQGQLFFIEPNEITAALNNPSIDWKHSDCSNFAENIKKSFAGITVTDEALLKVANKLISAMNNDEKKKFVCLTKEMGIISKEKTKEFLIRIVSGEKTLLPDKKESIRKNTYMEMGI